MSSLAQKHNNIFAVGDEDQSIYGFRGSKPEIMVNFSNKFKNSQILYLCKNYRSGSKIVQSAAALIKNNKKRYLKNFEANNDFSGEVNIYKFKNFEEQIKGIINYVENSKYNNIAILCRTNADKLFCKEKLSAYNYLNILTMHESKGLEFDEVWIVNVMEGICPFKHNFYEVDIEEERRLFYVAVTRAKYKLNICYCIGRKGIRKKKSLFIKELDL